jgi:RNA polymerase sigma factor (sigma-70 family)
MEAITDDTSENWLEQALEQFERPLLNYALGICRDPECSKDVVQDTFVKLATECADARPTNLAAWLFRVCRNRLIDLQRKNFRLVSGDADYSELEGTDEQSPQPDRTLEKKEDHAAVLRLVNALPPRERELVRLKFQANLSYKEIADITGLKEGHIGYLLHQAIKQLRDQCAKEGYWP